MGKRKKSKGLKNLPIFSYKSSIINTIKTNQVVVITGQTGCGKSTQVPKYLFKTGFSDKGIIASLHPRCIAAMTLAERVSEELDSKIGALVGYHVRFHHEESYETKIMFMTTGLMLQKMKYDTSVNRYSVIIVDEAHERSIQTDLIFGLMKEIFKTNSQIRMVIMSASLDVQAIRDYYGNCALIDVSNAVDKVEVIYRPVKDSNYLLAIKNVVSEILQQTKTGHILIFLQSEEKVRKCRKSLQNLPKTKSLAFFASMDNDEKRKVFIDHYGRRKIIVSTNVAETSLTIPGVDYVIDSGWVKRVIYNHETGVEKWITKHVSIAEANQRKGRTGRTGFGKCYRMYEEKCVTEVKNPLESFLNRSMPPPLLVLNEEVELIDEIMKMTVGDGKEVKRFLDYPQPEIQTVNLNSMIMALKAMSQIDIMKFPFIVPPDLENVKKSEKNLRDLSLLQDSGKLTRLGEDVCKIPVEPRLGKVAIIASQLPCRSRVLGTIAMLSVRNVLKSPTESKAIHQSFCYDQGDLFQLGNIFFEARENYFSRLWCWENAIEFAAMKYASRVYNQLNSLVPIPKFDHKFLHVQNNDNLMKKVFLSGFFMNIAVNQEINRYSTLNKLTASLHKTTTVERTEEIIMFLNCHDPTGSKSIVLQNCTNLNKEMLKNLNPSKYAIKTPLWKKIMKEQIESHKIDQIPSDLLPLLP